MAEDVKVAIERAHVANAAAFLALAGLLIDKGIMTPREIYERLSAAAAETDLSWAGLQAGVVVQELADVLLAMVNRKPSGSSPKSS